MKTSDIKSLETFLKLNTAKYTKHQKENLEK